MTHPTRCILLLVVAQLAVGCGTAQLTQHDDHAGQIAIRGSYMRSVSEARQLAIEHCGGRVHLIEPSDEHQPITFACANRRADAAQADPEPRSTGLQPGATTVALR